jgi:hypothetical protein
LVTRLAETHVHIRSGRSTSVATCVTRRKRTCT